MDGTARRAVAARQPAEPPPRCPALLETAATTNREERAAETTSQVATRLKVSGADGCPGGRKGSDRGPCATGSGTCCLRHVPALTAARRCRSVGPAVASVVATQRRTAWAVRSCDAPGSAERSPREQSRVLPHSGDRQPTGARGLLLNLQTGQLLRPCTGIGLGLIVEFTTIKYLIQII